MSVSLNALKEPFGIKNLFRTFKYHQDFVRDNPTYFYPDGFICFVGIQGSGKTLSAVNYVTRLLDLYPRCKLVTNLKLIEYPIVLFSDFFREVIDFDMYNALSLDEKEKIDDEIYQRYLRENRVFPFVSPKDFGVYQNGKEGVIYLIDELHLYFGSMKGNNNIDPASVQEICQQRKERVHIVGTTQFYGQLNINLRRHFDTVIVCKKRLFGYLQNNLLVERDSISTDDTSGQILDAKIAKKFWYFKSPKMFGRYDTYQIIQNGTLNFGLERSDFSGDRLSNGH